MRRIMKTAAAIVLTLAACGEQEQEKEPLGDIRGVEEIGSPDLTALAAGDVSFNSTTGKVTITLSGSESLVIVSKRAADSALLVNGVPQLDTTKVNLAIVSGTGAGLVKSLAINAAVANTTVVLDYYNGTFVPGIAPVSPATFGTAGTVVNFGAFGGGAFKVRGSSNADTFYAGQDTHAGNPNVLISFSGTYPDIEITSTTTPSLGFSLGLGNDVFDATSHKGGTVGTLATAVTVHGGGGNDTMIGGSGADTLYGDEGLNVIDESTGSTTSHTADMVYGLTTTTTLSGTNSTTVTYANWANTTTGVNVVVAHLATALVGGVTDNIDDTVGVVIGSPIADTMSCSQLTDVPCVLEGGAGDDTLSPGLSATNTEYLYGGDGNDTFAMNTIASHVSVIGGNVSDIVTTKNSYVDTVDYSSAISALSPANTTISMNGTAPATCTVATSTTIPPCIGVADSTPSGIVGSVHTDIRNDVTVAKCPTGVNSTGVVCTFKGNASGDTVYSGLGADVLTGGTGDDTFVIADLSATSTYTAGTASKVITGGGGNDTADFSHHTGGVTIHLNCTASTCANSGSTAALATTSAASSTTATTDYATAFGDLTTEGTSYAAITTPTALDIAAHTAVATAVAAAHTAATATATAVSHPGNLTDEAAAVTAAATATTDAQAAVTAVAADSGSISTTWLADATQVNADVLAVAAAATAAELISEGISLVNVNNAVCPAGGSESCAVISNGNADLIDFNGDGAVSGSALTCNSSSVVTVNASGLTADCGL